MITTIKKLNYFTNSKGVNFKSSVEYKKGVGYYLWTCPVEYRKVSNGIGQTVYTIEQYFPINAKVVWLNEAPKNTKKAQTIAINEAEFKLPYFIESNF